MKSTIYNLTIKDSSKRYGEDLQKLMDEGYKIYDTSFNYSIFIKVDVFEEEGMAGKSAWVRSTECPEQNGYAEFLEYNKKVADWWRNEMIKGEFED